MDIFDPVTFYYILTFAISFTVTILGVMLLGLHIAPGKELDNLRFSRNYLAISYFVLGISGFVSFLSQEETENESLMVSCTLIIASYQALLFTYTILALIQPLYIKRKQIFIQLGIITFVAILLLLTLFFTPHFIYNLVFYIVVVAYLSQLSFYTYLFRLKYNVCLRSLEEYYDEDEHIRLRWVNFSFYGALIIGMLALTSLFLNLLFPKMKSNNLVSGSIIFIFLMFSSATSAQVAYHHEKDSLLRVISSLTGGERLNAYYQLMLSVYHNEESMDSVQVYFNDYIQEARSQNNLKEEGMVYVNLLAAYCNREQMKDAIQLLTKLLKTTSAAHYASSTMVNLVCL